MRTRTLLPLFFLLLAIHLGAQSSSTDTATQEQQLVNQLNHSRAQAGLPELKVEPRLTEAARQHSQRMADSNSLGHVLPGEQQVAERLAATGLHFNRSGENVAYNTDCSGVHTGFMNSPPHKENILGANYTQVGVGIARDESGIYWVTEDFAQVLVQHSPEQAEAIVAKKFDALRGDSQQAAITRVPSPTLEDIACKMASTGKLDPRPVLKLPGVHYAITYNNSHPEELPSTANSVATEKSLRQYAVGACFAEGKSNPGGTYYVVMAFY